MKTLFITLLLGFASTIFGQQRMTGSNDLTLDQAIRLALDSNYITRTASNSLTIAQYGSTKANDNLLPTATATGSYGYQHYISNRYRASFSLDTASPGRLRDRRARFRLAHANAVQLGPRLF